MDKLKKFYSSKDWRNLSYKLKIETQGKCNRCDFQAITKEDYKKLIGHHKIELTENNVEDVSISLNPNNIEVVCLDCHNKEHKRFGHEEKKVYIVYGAPLSGKNTVVSSLYKYGDIIIDLDNIYQMITLEDKYNKPNNIRFNAFRVRDELLDQIKTRYGKWNNAYIIGGYPEKYERERLARELRAECIYVESSKEECLERAQDRPIEWIGYINDWFEKYNG